MQLKVVQMKQIGDLKNDYVEKSQKHFSSRCGY